MTRGCNKGRSVKKAVSYNIAGIISVGTAEPEITANQQKGAKQDQQEDTQLGVAEKLAKFPFDEHVIQAEIDAGKNREKADYGFDVRAVEVSDAIVVVGEAAGGHAAEGENTGVEDTHAACHKQKDLDQGETDIDQVKQLG